MKLRKMSFEEFQELHVKMGTVNFIVDLLTTLKIPHTIAARISGIKIQNFRKWMGGEHSISFLSMHSLYYKLVNKSNR